MGQINDRIIGAMENPALQDKEATVSSRTDDIINQMKCDENLKSHIRLVLKVFLRAFPYFDDNMAVLETKLKKLSVSKMSYAEEVTSFKGKTLGAKENKVLYNQNRFNRTILEIQQETDQARKKELTEKLNGEVLENLLKTLFPNKDSFYAALYEGAVQQIVNVLFKLQNMNDEFHVIDLLSKIAASNIKEFIPLEEAVFGGFVGSFYSSLAESYVGEAKTEYGKIINELNHALQYNMYQASPTTTLPEIYKKLVDLMVLKNNPPLSPEQMMALKENFVKTGGQYFSQSERVKTGEFEEAYEYLNDRLENLKSKQKS